MPGSDCTMRTSSIEEGAMEILLAKTAGFCFGVDRAVKLTYRLV